MAGKDKKSPKPVHKDRFLGKMFLRGDSVLLVIKIAGQMFPLANSCPDSNRQRSSLNRQGVMRRWEGG